MTNLFGTVLEDYIVFRIDNKKMYLLHDLDDSGNNLFLYKYGNFYLARNKMYVIPDCKAEDILEIDVKKEYTVLSDNLKIERDFAVFKPRSKYLYSLCSEEEENNLTRLLLSIFED